MVAPADPDRQLRPCWPLASKGGSISAARLPDRAFYSQGSGLFGKDIRLAVALSRMVSRRAKARRRAAGQLPRSATWLLTSARSGARKTVTYARRKPSLRLAAVAAICLGRHRADERRSCWQRRTELRRCVSRANPVGAHFPRFVASTALPGNKRRRAAVWSASGYVRSTARRWPLWTRLLSLPCEAELAHFAEEPKPMCGAGRGRDAQAAGVEHEACRPRSI